MLSFDSTTDQLQQFSLTAKHLLPRVGFYDQRETKMAKINIEKIKNDLFNVRDVDGLKKELIKIKSEISKINLKKEISTESNKRLKVLEKRYADLKKDVSKLQKQADKEIDRILTTAKKARSEAKKSFDKIAKTLKEEQQRLRKAISKKSTSPKKKTTKKAASKKKATAKKTTKKATRKKTSSKK